MALANEPIPVNGTPASLIFFLITVKAINTEGMKKSIDNRIQILLFSSWASFISFLNEQFIVNL